VLDDPTVNAFALPGGYIYVTRGILSYLTTEAELAGVVGHEIGHVTAMHAVQRISSQQLLQLGLGIGMAVVPELQQFGEVIGAGLGILFLKFSREDENQADTLGLRYMTRAGYDPRQMIEVMEMLDRVSSSEGSGRIPEWLSTHPNPENRIENIRTQVDRMHEDFDDMMVDRDRYLDHIDGLVFGLNPREGFFRANVFYQPELKFAYEFPEAWTTKNMKQAVSGVSPQQDAIIQITLSRESTPAEAADTFLAQSGITAAGVQKTEIHRLPAVTGQFSVRTEEGVLQGMAAFVSYDGNIYQILGYSTLQGWPGYAGVVERSLYSFDRLTDRSILSVQPMRIRIVTLEQDMRLEEFAERFPSAVPLETLALVNQVETGAVLRAGQLAKRVVREEVQ
jgi:predicted Zn-dependent protease